VLKKLSCALEESGTYIDKNAEAIVNYGERRRCGELISTGFVESTINHLIAKRFVGPSQQDSTSSDVLGLPSSPRSLFGSPRQAWEGES
jgi:hypothetical protein